MVARRSSSTGRGSSDSLLPSMTLLENAPSGIVIVNRRGRILYVNPSATRMLGKDCVDLVGTDAEAFHACGEQFDLMIDLFRRTGRVDVPEVEMRSFAGENFWAKVSWTRTRFDGINAAVLWIENITAQRLANATRTALFDTAPLPMVLAAIDDGIVLHANRRAIELFAGDRDGRGFRLDHILGADTTPAFLRRLRNGGYVDDFEVTLNTSYGLSYCGGVSGQSVTLDGRRCVLVGITDLTDRKQAEETLRRFFDGAPLAMLLVRLHDLQVVRINRRASELFAPQPGTTAAALESHLGVEHGRRFIAQLQDGGFVESFECRLATDWGESFWANLSGQIIDIDDERCVLIGVSDITDRKRAEEDLQQAKREAELATEAKSQFLATMSHEIRTPMNGVLGMLDLLSNMVMPVEQQEMVSVIGDSARTLLAIIDDVLDLSKIEAGKMGLEKTALHLRQTVATSAELVAHLARAKGVELAWRVAPELPEVLLGDPTRLRQVLLNLLSNAVKFTERGRVVLRVEPAAEGFRFAVEDSGIGMTDEQQTRLFQPFAQADADTTRRFGGTGLGLAICKRLVELMGGEISVESAVGKGSTFSFCLALSPAPEGAEAAAASADLAGLHVLVVDPLAESRDCLADAVRAQGASAATADSDAEASAMLAQGIRADVGLLDESCDPFLFAGRAQPFPLLALSARGNGPCAGPHADHWRSLGVTALAKPVRWAALGHAVAAAVGRGSRSAPAVRPDAPPLRAAAGAAGRRILVAEDNHTNRLVIAKQLDYLGCSYDLVEDGEAAWAALGKTSYGLLLTDCLMPGLDGYALARRLRAAEAGSSHRLPVVALTANALSGDADRCLAAGMDDYLAKPVTLERLDAVLGRWLSRRDGTAPATVPSVPAGDGAAAAEVVDCAALGELVGDGSPDTLSAILQSFTEYFPDLLEAARRAVVQRDRQALRDAAHAAKGAARTACAKRLAAILLDLETKAPRRVAFARLTRLIDDAALAYADVEALAARGLPCAMLSETLPR